VSFRSEAAPVTALRIAFCALGLLVLSCGRAPNAPSVSGPVRVALTLSSTRGDPTHPLTITMRVRNFGRTPVFHSGGGACSVGPYRISLVAPGRDHELDPCSDCPGITCVAPGCAGTYVRLDPLQTLTYQRTFGGSLVDCSGMVPGPSGQYRVEASFSSRSRLSVADQTISTSATFDWTAASPN
jgi:hypothetical protein